MRNCFPLAAVASCCILVVAVTPAPAGAAPQQSTPTPPDLGGWAFTSQVGSGFSFYFGEQAADPAFGFAVGRFLSDSLQVEGQLLGVPGRPREHTSESESSDHVVWRSSSWQQRSMLIAMTRLNLYLGEGRVRPYLSFGAGLGWGQEESGWTTAYAAGADRDADTETRRHERRGIAFATLLGSGVDIGLSDHWRVRPEVIMPWLWGVPQPGYVTLAVGITYTTRPPRSVTATYAARSRSLARESAATAWRRVVALALGDSLRLQLSRGTRGVRDGNVEQPDSRTVLGEFVAADEGALLVRITQGARTGTWRIPRAYVERIERGRFERNGPWEGVLGGFVVGAGIGALAYLGSGGGDDHEIWIPAGTIMFGAPAALIGGISDHRHRSFEATELVYDVRLVAAAR